MARHAFFVDTSVLISHFRSRETPTPFDQASIAFGRPLVSEIVIFELEVGARRAGRALEFHRHFPSVRSYPLTLAILLEAAEIQADLLRANQVIGLPDTFIAATAIRHDIPLFTLNTAHFKRINALRLLHLEP